MRLITASMSLPNILSLSRIFCVPIIVFCIIRFNEYNNCRYIAIFTMLVAGLSDFLDGYLARKRNEITKLGAYLDSIADKLLLTSAFILLACDNFWPEPRIPNWLSILVVAKQGIVTIGVLFITFYTGTTLKPSILGKISTDLQIGAITVVFFGSHIPVNIITTIFWIVAFFATISLVHYLYIGVSYGLMYKKRVKKIRV